MVPPEPSEERLQRTLARVGFGSRRTCEVLISEGRVKVNGETATLGQEGRPRSRRGRGRRRGAGGSTWTSSATCSTSRQGSSRRHLIPRAARMSSTSCLPSHECSQSAVSTRLPRVC